MTDRIQQLAALAAVCGAIALNYLSASGDRVGGLADALGTDVYVTPAGYVFATTWALIFTGLLALAIYQALPAQRTNPRLRAARPWLILNALCNGAWIVAFVQPNLGLALVLLVAVLVTALALRRALDSDAGGAERWLRIPISVYAGWSSIATVANASYLLANREWSALGLSYPAWAVIMLLVAGAIGLAGRFAWGDRAFAAVFAWAFAGVAIEQAAQPAVAVTAALVALVAAATLLPDPPLRRLRAWSPV